MKDLCRNLPLLTGLILNHLDDQSLINCKIASRELSKYLEGTKLINIRIIRKYRSHFEGCSESKMRHRDDTCLEYWNKVVKIASVEIVEQLSIATQWCFRQETFPKYKCISEEDTEIHEQAVVDILPLSIRSYKKQSATLGYITL